MDPDLYGTSYILDIKFKNCIFCKQNAVDISLTLTLETAPI